MIDAIAKLVRCESLSEMEASAAFETIMRGDATPIQIAGFIVALREISSTRVGREATAWPPSTFPRCRR